MQLFNYNGKRGAHMPTNTALLNLKAGCEADCVRDLVNGFMDPIQGMDLWPSWQVNNCVYVYWWGKCVMSLHTCAKLDY